MSTRELTILYVGPLAYGGTCLNRLMAFEELGFPVVRVDTGVPDNCPLFRRLLFRLWRRFGGDSWSSYINRKISNVLESTNPAVVWIDKGLVVRADTLMQVKARRADAITVSYSPDDMLNPSNQTRHYLECLPLFDYHVTTKSYNVDELKQLGARRVIKVDNAYSPHSHRPIPLSRAERARLGGPVGFIGFWEMDREEYLTFLAENDVPVRVWGPWKRNRKYHPNMRVEGRVAWGDDYARAINAFDINLCFLRKENRDVQTSRSIELPACGAFMLAERTDEHLALFVEGKEAEFFDGREELLDKVKYYSRHEVERRRIAMAGRQRCLQSGYSDRERLKEVLAVVLEDR